MTTLNVPLDLPTEAADVSPTPEPVRNTWGAKPQTKYKPVVHSWSSLVEFQNCPHRWYHTKLIKSVTEGQSEQMTEGNEHHKALELAVRDGAPLPDKYKQDAGLVQGFRNAPGIKIVEWSWGLTRDWTECKFFDSNVWVRGKIDVGVIGTKKAFLGDYKTGKKKSDYEQLGLFSIPAFVRWPYIEEAKTAYIWLHEADKDKIDPAVYRQEDLPSLRADFGWRFKSIEESVRLDKFHKMPSGLCSWCPVGRERCEFWRAYKGLPK